MYLINVDAFHSQRNALPPEIFRVLQNLRRKKKNWVKCSQMKAGRAQQGLDWPDKRHTRVCQHLHSQFISPICCMSAWKMWEL